MPNREERYDWSTATADSYDPLMGTLPQSVAETMARKGADYYSPEPERTPFDPTALSTAPEVTSQTSSTSVTNEPGGKKKKKKKGKKKGKGKKGMGVGLMPDPSAPGNLPEGDYYGGGRGDFGDPYNVYLSTVPLMNQVRDYQIGDSMAKAGFTGNRYSTHAMEQAGRIGGETTLALQQKLNELLYGQTNQDLDRALQAAIAGGSLGMNIDSLTGSRMGAMGSLASADQARANAAARAKFSAMNQPEPDNFGRILSIINASTRLPGDTNVQTQSGAEPGAIDYAGDALAIYLQGQEAGFW
jgi:hypothetical protein